MAIKRKTKQSPAKKSLSKKAKKKKVTVSLFDRTRKKNETVEECKQRVADIESGKRKPTPAKVNNKWAIGNTGGGRTLGSQNFMTKFLKAIDTVETSKGKELFIHLLEQAYKNPAILVAVLDRLLPALRRSENFNLEGHYDMSDKETKEIQDILKQRYSAEIECKEKKSGEKK